MDNLSRRRQRNQAANLNPFTASGAPVSHQVDFPHRHPCLINGVAKNRFDSFDSIDFLALR
jgi:hypothetical protein